jgi:hypothetical protein
MRDFRKCCKLNAEVSHWGAKRIGTQCEPSAEVSQLDAEVSHWVPLPFGSQAANLPKGVDVGGVDVGGVGIGG